MTLRIHHSLPAQGPQVAGGCPFGQDSTTALGRKGQRKWGRQPGSRLIPFSVKQLEGMSEAGLHKQGRLPLS